MREGQGTRRRDMLPAFFSKIDTTAYDNLLMGTMVVVGVFGLFRVGEICYSSTNKERVIRIMDVKWSEEGMTIRLRSSKTDIGKAGINKFITNTTDFWPDPCKLMKSIIMGKTRGYGPNDPVFTTKQGQHISRTRLVTFMREGLSKAFPNIPATDWSGISLRRGGATSAARAGIPGEIIERLGHWRSNVYKRYLESCFGTFFFFSIQEDERRKNEGSKRSKRRPAIEDRSSRSPNRGPPRPFSSHCSL